MKFVARFLSLTVLAGAAMFFASCGGDDNETKSEEETQLEQLSTTWTLSTAFLNTTEERTVDFNNMKLTLSGPFSPGSTYNYSVTGTTPTPSPWPRQGTWRFGADVKTEMIRTGNSENLPMKYSLNGNTLIIEFDCDGCDFAGGGRVASVDGEWKFTFTKLN